MDVAPSTLVLVEDGLVSAEAAATMLQSPAAVLGTPPRASIPSTAGLKTPSSSSRALVGVGFDVGVGGGAGVPADLVGRCK